MPLTFLPHPMLAPPSKAVLATYDPQKKEDVAELLEIHRVHHRVIELSRSDPYHHGFEPQHWLDASAEFEKVSTLWIFGGNRSGKTAYSAKQVVRALVQNPGTLIFCWAQNDELSKLVQQSAIYAELPVELKRKQRDSVTKVVYSRGNGFTDKFFILPNGSRCVFKTYTQFSNDPTVVEGVELGYKSFDGTEPPYLNIGNWFDEYLGDGALLEAIKYRLLTRDAKNLITFTPIGGYTSVVRSVIEGAETIKEVPAELLGGRKVPLVQKPVKGDSLIRYFHTKDNAWNNYKRTVAELESESDEEILVRAYGVPTKAATTRFPKFQRHINVVPHEDIPTTGLTRYLLIDPAGAKNWFMQWVGVDASDTWWVYREWPSAETFGDWALFGKAQGMRSGNAKWRPGPAQKGLGWGIRDYIDEIYASEGRLRAAEGEWRTLDDTEEIFERIIDPRLGAAKYSSGDAGQTSIIQELEDMGLVCIPAPGVGIDDGIQILMGLMAYDDKREIDGTNRPHFYVSERCGNTIAGIENYTGDDGKNEAWKDCIDPLRYGGVSQIRHISPEMFDADDSGAGGY